MPYGYKLENEENLILSKETPKKFLNLRQNKLHKKTKRSRPDNTLRLPSSSAKAKSAHFKKIHKPKINTKKSLSHSTSISQKIQFAMNKIKLFEYSNYFFSNKIRENNISSLHNIEQNAMNGKYKSIYLFFQELRKIWVFYLNNYQNNREVYDKTLKMIVYSEQISKQVEEGKEKPKVVRNNFNGEKPMTTKDKMVLANYIRNLPEDQLKGFVNLFDESSEIDKKKEYIEIDIEKLSTNKLREIEKYVKSCMKSTKTFVPARYKEEFQNNLKNKKVNQSEEKPKKENDFKESVEKNESSDNTKKDK